MWVAYAAYLSYHPTQDTPIDNSIPSLVSSRVTWLAIVLVLVLYLSRALGWKVLRREFCPTLYHRVQEEAQAERRQRQLKKVGSTRVPYVRTGR